MTSTCTPGHTTVQSPTAHRLPVPPLQVEDLGLDRPAATRTVRGKVINQDGDGQSYTATVTVKSA
ncbi:MAG: hypothetical protein H0V43_05740 [Gemmatimonadales bacterium]|nr:hypothetical protein [Gemmatimonadales bacterium]